MMGGQFGKDIHHHNVRRNRLCQFAMLDRRGLPLINADGQPSKFVEPRVALISVYERSGSRNLAHRCRFGDHAG